MFYSCAGNGVFVSRRLFTKSCRVILLLRGESPILDASDQESLYGSPLDLDLSF